MLYYAYATGMTVPYRLEFGQHVDKRSAVDVTFFGDLNIFSPMLSKAFLFVIFYDGVARNFAVHSLLYASSPRKRHVLHRVVRLTQVYWRDRYLPRKSLFGERLDRLSQLRE